MAKGPGRPPRPTEFDEATLAAARSALLDAGRQLRLPQVRTPSPTRREPNRTVLAPRPLDLAVLALELGQALEAVAAEHVSRARDGGVTWEQVGEAFGITMQSAHSRFRALS
jgi:hypothetical protein